ncbi:MAG: HNH endonuclease [Lachnospirales bacterium]
MRDIKFCVCGKIIEKVDKYCDKCKSKQAEKISARNKCYDKYYRDTKSKAFYNSTAWRRLVSIVRLRNDGLCALCYHNGLVTKGTMVHHIVPLKSDWNKRLDTTNCILLCAECHSKVHSEYDKNKYEREKMQKLLKEIVAGGGF